MVRHFVHSLSAENNPVPSKLWWKETVLECDVYKWFVQDCSLREELSQG